ncbi:MAG: hypothetical protein IJN54_14255 [Lachnospiraceae bacterium]|nr:hypothetical protein [Lachnospiraceae bacterium]
MKKKSIIIGISIVIVVLLGTWLMMNHNGKVLGSMNQTYTEPTTRTSTISFLGEAGDRIKFSFAADKRHENLDMILYDSEGNAVYELDSADKLVTYFNLDSTDEYTLSAEYRDFIGKFKVKVYKVD